MAINKKTGNIQIDKFVKSALAHGCDESESAFSAKLKKLASVAKAPVKQAKKPKTKTP